MRLYVDWKNLYKRPANSQERLRGEEPITQFGRMCQKLGIELIAASSPQAKGRVERVHGTHQDRLVKKLRRQAIATHAQANAYLEAEYLPEHNRRFARPAARREDYHRRAPCAAKLDRIFRLESQRTISDDWVVRYDNRFFQLEPQSRNYAPARSRVVVCEWPGGGVWRLSIGAARCRGGRSRRPPGPGSGSGPACRLRGWRSGSGCHRRIIPGDKPSGERWRGEPPSPRHRRWPCPPLRPKRSPYGLAGLRSGQGQRR